ncbi:MAG: leucyl aminopeptidase [Gammaproteobacteria bacterium]|nr:leucyl aminopeptidase [Gammaproteobacteria bacterium]
MPAIAFTAKNLSDTARHTTQCAIIPLASDGKLPGLGKLLDKTSTGLVKEAIKLGDFSGKEGQHQLLTLAGNPQRILLVGYGKPGSIDRKAIRSLCNTIYTALKPLNLKEATLHLNTVKLKAADRQWCLGFLARHITTANYRYQRTLSKPKKAAKLARLIVNVGNDIPVASANRALKTGKLVGEGVNSARELANLPGNICTPTYLASEARKLSRRSSKLSVSILDEKKMRELGMGALLSVSAGSQQEARLIVMNFKGGKAKDAPYVLVGKGITFDSGGISLKPGAKMDEMKFDMGGAASVFGTMQAVSELDLPINVIGIVAAAENMPSGTATKPGDVVTSMAGKTIEVLNTDAEGRLVLCDALTYARRFKPATVIDIATLTGACVVALGSHASALFTRDDALAQALLDAGEESHDRNWRMPLWDDYQRQINSNFADIANIGGPGGGSITAACFLSRFTEGLSWAHLDIAGSAWDSTPKGATGRPVAMLTQYLIDKTTAR